MTTPTDRLDLAMKERRLDLGRNWRQVADSAGISTEALRAIRRGQYKPSDLTQRKIESALQWAPGSIAAILAGGEPTLAHQRRRASDAAPGAAIGAQLRKALQRSWMSEAEFGEMFDLDEQAIRDRLDGRVPISRPELENFCEQLGLDPDQVRATAGTANDDAKETLRATP